WRPQMLNYKACDPNAKFISPASCPASAGNGGELLVIMEPGWAPGRATPAVDTSGGVPSASDPVNPYPASEGGPRNRSIAAIIDGPSTGNLVYEFPWIAGTDDGRSPVTTHPDTTSDPRQENNSTQAKYYGPTGYDQASGYRASSATAPSPANSIPGDDAIVYGAPAQTPTGNLCPDSDPACGRERQAQTVDFMPTIAALMKISVPSNQLAGRILQEPFGVPLALFNENEDIGVAEPPPLPPPPPPPVVIQPPPPPPPSNPFTFHGLVRKVHAEVGQLVGKTFNPVEKARSGADLSAIQLTADFGRPQAQVTLTLYHKGVRPGSSARVPGRRRAKARSSGGAQNLVTLVRFCPFSVTRGPGVKLRFSVPPRFAPDHIGLTVQETIAAPKVVPKVPTSKASTRGAGGPAAQAAAAKPACPAGAVKAIGRAGGAVVPIRNAALLHTRKRGGARKPAKRPSHRPRAGAHGG
ncbi:MAG TPA: hypothetical protein VGN69_03855, partial [Solirubrobacteraceae bacterium]|nr:hypothetical protein [Solirubrobacteraceae bacterium]